MLGAAVQACIYICPPIIIVVAYAYCALARTLNYSVVGYDVHSIPLVCKRAVALSIENNVGIVDSIAIEVIGCIKTIQY